MPPYCRWHIKASPTQDLRPPCQVSILAISEEVLVKEFAIDGNVFHHGAPIERGCAGGSEYVLHLFILPTIQFFCPTIQVPQVAAKVHPGGIDDIGFFHRRSRPPAQQLPAYTA